MQVDHALSDVLGGACCTRTATGSLFLHIQVLFHRSQRYSAASNRFPITQRGAHVARIPGLDPLITLLFHMFAWRLDAAFIVALFLPGLQGLQILI